MYWTKVSVFLSIAISCVVAAVDGQRGTTPGKNPLQKRNLENNAEEVSGAPKKRLFQSEDTKGNNPDDKQILVKSFNPHETYWQAAKIRNPEAGQNQGQNEGPSGIGEQQSPTGGNPSLVSRGLTSVSPIGREPLFQSSIGGGFSPVNGGLSPLSEGYYSLDGGYRPIGGELSSIGGGFGSVDAGYYPLGGGLNSVNGQFSPTGAGEGFYGGFGSIGGEFGSLGGGQPGGYYSLGGEPGLISGRPSLTDEGPNSVNGQFGSLGGSPRPIDGGYYPVGGGYGSVGETPGLVNGRPSSVGGNLNSISGEPGSLSGGVGAESSSVNGRPSSIGGVLTGVNGPQSRPSGSPSSSVAYSSYNGPVYTIPTPPLQTQYAYPPYLNDHKVPGSEGNACLG